MGRASPARARLRAAASARLAWALVVILAGATAAGAGSSVSAPIVGGSLTSDFPAVGALLLSADPDADAREGFPDVIDD